MILIYFIKHIYILHDFIFMLKCYLDSLLLSQEFFFKLHKSFLYVGLILLKKKKIPMKNKKKMLFFIKTLF